MQALAAIDSKLINEQRLTAFAISSLGVLVSGISGNENKREDFDAIPGIELRAEAREAISKQTAKVLTALMREGKIPSWAKAELGDVLELAGVR